jgi:hypothetical protein
MGDGRWETGLGGLGESGIWGSSALGEMGEREALEAYISKGNEV